MVDSLRTGKHMGYVGGVQTGIPGTAIDERIGIDDVLGRVTKLGSLRRDLESALVAIQALETDARDKLAEREQLQLRVSELVEDKKVAEALLSVPESALQRLLTRAAAKARVRGLIEGLLIGLCTGVASSLIAWYITK